MARRVGETTCQESPDLVPPGMATSGSTSIRMG
jgi:hypothetical protein